MQRNALFTNTPIPHRVENIAVKLSPKSVILTRGDLVSSLEELEELRYSDWTALLLQQFGI
jgi:hypothetical protein